MIELFHSIHICYNVNDDNVNDETAGEKLSISGVSLQQTFKIHTHSYSRPVGGRGEGEERGVCVGDASRSGVVACQELCRISALQHDIPVGECRIQVVNDSLQYRVTIQLVQNLPLASKQYTTDCLVKFFGTKAKRCTIQ